MKIGILTFHRANNFGAVLQAVALNQYIDSRIGDCEIVDYWPNNVHRPYKSNIRKLLHNIKALCLCTKKSFREDEIKNIRFQKFRSKNMKLSSQDYDGDTEMLSSQFNYDCLISGSDQILNTTITGCSKSFYLNFTDKIKKISYASSFGRSDISSEEVELIQSEFPQFTNVSVRERNAGDIIYKLTAIRPQVVVDPVFLLSAADWNNYCKPASVPKHYIAVYAMEYSSAMENAIIAVRNLVGLPVILVPGGQSAKKLPGEQHCDYGPAEFLSFIKNADYVITNSFHGLSFANIFGKKYYCVAHTTRNIRLEELMHKVSCEDKIIYGEVSQEDLPDYLVDSTKVSGSLQNEIALSKQYLRMAILKK